MLKIVTAAATALFVAASPLAYAQTPSPSSSSPERFSALDWNKLTDLRIDRQGRVAAHARTDKVVATGRERYPCQSGGSESPVCKSRRNNG